VSIHTVPLRQIDAARLESLRENLVPESRTLDYKERLPASEDDKKDLLQDVTAFANSVGGDLIYGVRERRENDKATGEPEAIVGLSLATETLDQAILRVENMLLDGIEPRVPGTRVLPIRRAGDPPCLLIRVPRSPLGPHWVTYRGARRFYGRGDAGNFLLDWGQIREGFVEAHGAQERLSRFRRERVIRLLAGETPIPTAAGPKVIFHALPLSSVDVWAGFRTLDTLTQVIDAMTPLGGNPSNWHYNLDGFVVYTVRTDLDRQTYSQCFRDGGLEGFAPLDGDGKGRGFYGHNVEVPVVRALTNYQRLWRWLGVVGPMMFALTVSGVHGMKILGRSEQSIDHDVTFDHDVTLLPELVVQDATASEDGKLAFRSAARLLHPLFDLLWNAGGWEQSPWYDSATGEWTRVQ
jgi:hypothetical protein